MSIFVTPLPSEQHILLIKYDLFPNLTIQISRPAKVSWTLLSLFRYEKFKFLK